MNTNIADCEFTPFDFQTPQSYAPQTYDVSELQQLRYAFPEHPFPLPSDRPLQPFISEHLQAEQPSPNSRNSRSTSVTSNASAPAEVMHVGRSHPAEPIAASSEMSKYGRRNHDTSWSCAYPNCTSNAAFYRVCDIRKHFNRHRKILFCRREGCPQSQEEGCGGFSSKKDRARHEASHDPKILCEWPDCPRIFSRMDNMVSMDYLYGLAIH